MYQLQECGRLTEVRCDRGKRYTEATKIRTLHMGLFHNHVPLWQLASGALSKNTVCTVPYIDRLIDWLQQ